jgi:hypothetical protein
VPNSSNLFRREFRQLIEPTAAKRIAHYFRSVILDHNGILRR